MTALSVEGCSLTNSVVVVTVAILFPTSLARAIASVPVTTYSALTYPRQLPDAISYQPSFSERNVPTDLSYNLPTISASSLASLLTFT